LITAQGLDLWTTHAAIVGHRGVESNPFMQGSDAKRIAWKTGTTAGVLWLTTKLDRYHPRIARVTLYAFSGAIGAVAVHNSRVGHAR
jgi:hypothetical protein